jgi:NAD(P)-dependent dehydrogenase (short-subunit alcohol dehydrogenase family)
MAGVALITGAAIRIGRAISERLAQEGWTVAIHHHSSTDAAQELIDKIVSAGGRAAGFVADLSQEDHAQSLIDRVRDELGPVTCLVNSASVFERDDLDSTTLESWAHHFSVNLRAPFVLTQQFSQQVPTTSIGNIINILDQRVWNLTPHFTSYTLSKATLWTLTQTTAMALAPRIRVNAIGPGATLPSSRQSEEEFRLQVEATPLQRPVSVDEISRAVKFILDSPTLTGQMIALDAGQHLGGTPAPTRINE